MCNLAADISIFEVAFEKGKPDQMDLGSEHEVANEPMKKDASCVKNVNLGNYY